MPQLLSHSLANAWHFSDPDVESRTQPSINVREDTTMARRASDVLTERESQIMGILWELGKATSEQVRERLPGDPHDSSVRTLLRVLHTKGYVRLNRRKRPATYRPLVSQARVQQKAAQSLLHRFFGGSAEALVLRLIEDEQLSQEQLAQLKKTSGHTRRGGKAWLNERFRF